MSIPVGPGRGSAAGSIVSFSLGITSIDPLKHNLLFEKFDDLTASAIKSEIENTLENYEPRIKLEDVSVKPEFDMNEFHVTLNYIIVGMDVPQQELTFALLPTR